MSVTDPYGPDSVAVYRLFNITGALLYVGISANPKVRFAQHSDDKMWWEQVGGWTVEWFADRETALAVEALAIVEESPAYNLAGFPAEVVDEHERQAERLALVDRYRPDADMLNVLFLTFVRAKSLPARPTPRRRWQPVDAEQLYVRARQRAGWWAVRSHHRFVERWNVQQEKAWRAWAGVR